MCGIIGFLSPKYTEERLRSITSIIRHRGPDADGFYFDEAGSSHIGLGHRRLSIIDLSCAGNQPMYSADGRFVMIYNGEVYNFQDIRNERMPGTSWHSSSDSEVILECYARYGVECLEWFNGMFALAIWDKHDKKLLIARDRIGIKPFYYFSKDGEFVFSSELKGLQGVSEQTTLDHSAIANYLYLGYIPQEQTIYKDHYKLLPGHYAVISTKGIEKNEPYWKLEDQVAEKTIRNEQAAKNELKGLLEKAVTRCMISDVPLGIFLSGGVDSSLVAAVAQKHSKEKIKTFSIAFNEQKYDESGFAQQVANHIGADHHQFRVNETEAKSIIHDFLNIYDEPYGDMSGIPTYLVSRMAREHVTVALSGDGADELFMGYGFYTWARRLNNPLLKTFRQAIGSSFYMLDKNKFRSKSFLFKFPQERISSNIFSQNHGNWAMGEINELLKEGFKYQFDEQLETTSRKLEPEERQSFFDLKNYLPEELLTKVDRASMQHSLEVRVPFLDSEVINFALNLDKDLKIKNGVQKHLLKEVLYDYAPKSLFDRPKWGFAVPMKEWLKGDLSYLIEEYLSSQQVEKAGVLDPLVVTRYVALFRAGEDFRYHRIWLLIILQKWLLEKHPVPELSKTVLTN